MANRPQIPVFQGANVWRLLRTDRDGASARDIPQMAAAAVRFFLERPTGLGAKHELTPTGTNEWRFGSARPFRVLAISRTESGLLAAPVGPIVADRHKSVPGTIPTVQGQRPWWVLVRFDWRAPDTTIDYPAVREGLFGRSYELQAADWLLDRAVRLPAADPDDRTWGDAMGDRAVAATDELGRVLLPSLGIAALLAILWLTRK